MLTILTYNIRYNNPNDGANSWENRKYDVAQLISDQNPNVFCLQETQQSQKDFLETQFQNFGLVGVGRADGWLGGEMVNIFYEKNRFEKLSNGDFWLSDTPDVVGSCTWGNRLPRLVSWIQLLEKSTNHIFFVFNTHFDHESLPARQKSTKLLHQKITEIAGNYPAFIAGDFNLTPNESTYKSLITYFEDAKSLSPMLPLQNTTFNNFGKKGITNMWIDYIFLSQKNTYKVKNYQVIDALYNGKFPSDHFALKLEVEI